MVPHRSEAETGLSHFATLRGGVSRELPARDDRPLGLEPGEGQVVAGLVVCQGACRPGGVVRGKTPSRAGADSSPAQWSSSRRSRAPRSARTRMPRRATRRRARYARNGSRSAAEAATSQPAISGRPRCHQPRRANPRPAAGSRPAKPGTTPPAATISDHPVRPTGAPIQIGSSAVLPRGPDTFTACACGMGASRG